MGACTRVVVEMMGEMRSNSICKIFKSLYQWYLISDRIRAWGRINIKNNFKVLVIAADWMIKYAGLAFTLYRFLLKYLLKEVIFDCLNLPLRF